MPSRDVFLLMRHMDTVLRRKAYYTATAYHRPERLKKDPLEKPPGKEDYAANRRQLAQMMGLR